MGQAVKAVALFSGGLDSILAVKLVEEQGVDVTCLHFYSPFFGSPEKLDWWRRIYGLRIKAVDVGDAFTAMVLQGPAHGFGSVMNPCIDCKILMLRHAHEIMRHIGGCVIISGEVLGQRPMSQRREAMNIISRDSFARDVLLRPLSALHFDPTQAEKDGRIDRERLCNISGRGRKEQLQLAVRFGLREIPTPAGGCRLTEQEAVRSHWTIATYKQDPKVNDFYLANVGRQFWRQPDYSVWLTIGRKQKDNESILKLASSDDVLLKVADVAGPVALLRGARSVPDAEGIAQAAAFMATFAPKAMQQFAATNEPLLVRAHRGSLDVPGDQIRVTPDRNATLWAEPSWEKAGAALKEDARRRAMEQQKKSGCPTPRKGGDRP